MIENIALGILVAIGYGTSLRLVWAIGQMSGWCDGFKKGAEQERRHAEELAALRQPIEQEHYLRIARAEIDAQAREMLRAIFEEETTVH